MLLNKIYNTIQMDFQHLIKYRIHIAPMPISNYVSYVSYSLRTVRRTFLKSRVVPYFKRTVVVFVNIVLKIRRTQTAKGSCLYRYF